jgi:hypothetical protein
MALVVVSCIFGTRFRTLYPAPSCPEVSAALLFSNNLDLRREAVRKGWRFEEVPKDNAPLTSDYAASSLQSKYVKFMRFLSDRPDLWGTVLANDDDKVLYMDHKFHITPEHVRTALRLLVSEPPPQPPAATDAPAAVGCLSKPTILIRETPLEKTSVWDEVRCGWGQPRYAATMKETEEFVRQ